MQSSRISQLSVVRNYNNRLFSSQSKLSRLMRQGETFQKFFTVAEDTANGVRALGLRRNISRNLTSTSNVATAKSILEGAEGQINLAGQINNNFSEKVVQVNNGENDLANRQIIANELIQMRDEMLTVMNGRFSDNYLFGGINLDDKPFTYVEDQSGIFNQLQTALSNLNTAIGTVTDPTDQAALTTLYNDINSVMADVGQQVADKVSPVNKFDIQASLNALAAFTGANTQAELGGALDSFKDALNQLGGSLKFHGYDVATTLNPESVSFNQQLYNEQTRDYYVDIGLGVQFDSNGNVDKSTAFKMSFDGLEIFGTGENNIIFIMDKVINSLGENHAADVTGMYHEQFLAAKDKINMQLTIIGSGTSYLDFTKTRLAADLLTLSERQVAVELDDPAEIITNFEMAKMAYNAALQMGQSLIQPTLMDYIK